MDRRNRNPDLARQFPLGRYEPSTCNHRGVPIEVVGYTTRGVVFVAKSRHASGAQRGKTQTFEPHVFAAKFRPVRIK